MKQLYDVTITFDPKDLPGEVDAVALRGEFLFYRSGLTGHTDETGMMDCEKKFPPALYEESMENIGGLYCELMEKNPEGLYETSLRLPAGAYQYHFLVNPRFAPPGDDPRQNGMTMVMKDGSQMGLANGEAHMASGFSGLENHILPDPKNLPAVPTVTGKQQNSILFVGTAAECPWLPTPKRSDAGTVTYLSYPDIEGNVRSLAVYLPPRFDRQKEYPLVLVSHGGGGNEGDWPVQGGIGNIMDNLIAAGKTEPAILACMNNSVYRWDFKKIAENCESCVIPFLEKIFPVSKSPARRAFCGLSMGSMTTLYMYMHRARVYDYYGAFSGGIAGGEHFTLEDPHLKDVTLMIGTAEEDIAYNEREIGVPPTIRALKAKGLPYLPYFTTSGHDWFCWPQMFAHFAEHVLWSKN